MKRSMLAIALFVSGCGTSTVLVPPGVPVKLAEPVQAKILVSDAQNHWVEGKSAVTIPAGWYILPPPTTAPSN